MTANNVRHIKTAQPLELSRKLKAVAKPNLTVLDGQSTQNDEVANVKSVLGEMIDSSKCYKTGKEYLDLLMFLGRFSSYSPFNLLLIHIQNPQCQYFATAKKFKNKFGRSIKEGARPMIILQPHGPVAFVYDLEDTIGEVIPPRVLNPFLSYGFLDGHFLFQLFKDLEQENIWVGLSLMSKKQAGYIFSLGHQVKDGKTVNTYSVKLNQKHDAPTLFTTFIHELAHLYLGHIQADETRGIKDRTHIKHVQREIEAESVAYVVCKRHQVEADSCAYLGGVTGSNETHLYKLDVDLIVKVVAKLEKLIGKHNDFC